MDPKRQYAESHTIERPRTKSKATALNPIAGDAQYAKGQALVRLLEDGRARITIDKDWLATEEYLARRPSDERALAARDRLAKLRSGAQKQEPPPAADVPQAIAAALAFLSDATRPARRDRRAEIARLEDGLSLIDDALLVAVADLDAIRDRLVGEQAARDHETWRALQLRKFRTAQQLAAIADEEYAFRRSRIDGGYTPWRSDALPSVLARVGLVLGSESDWDSEISRARRQFEAEKVI